MKSFTFSRFRNVVRYLFCINRRMLLTTAVLPFSVILLFIIINFVEGDSLSYYSSTWGIPMGYFTFCLMFLSAFCGARMVYSSRKRAGEYSALLVLPASNIEKFVALFLVCVLVPLVVFSVSFWLPFFISHFGMAVHQVSHFVSETSKFLAGMSSQELGAVTLMLGLPLSSLAIFIFCGAFFSRLRFIMGVVLHVILIGVISTATIKISETIDFDEYVVNETALVWWAVAFVFLLTIALIWVSFRLFCRSQAVQGRFLSV